MKTKLFISFAACVAASVLMSGCSKEESATTTNNNNSGPLVIVDLYSGHNYYMWDAAQNYWSGHEWDAAEAWQPTAEEETNDNYPKSNADPRWYNEGGGAFEASVNPLFNQLPNANEMAWYILEGDAHWDNSTQWEAFGTTHTGGIWLKRLSVIAQENGKALPDFKLTDPNGADLRTSYSSYEVSPVSGKPAASEIGKYFFLPALGYYNDGQLINFGSYGSYWSSSALPLGRSRYSYELYFASRRVYLYNGSRYDGCLAQPFE